MFRKCRNNRNLVNKNDWLIIDKDIHELQLAFSDDIFDAGILFIITKMESNSIDKKICRLFY